MPIRIEVLNLAVVGPLVRDVKRSGNWATVGVETALVEEVAVQLFVQVVDGIIKCQQDNLRHGIDAQAAYRNWWNVSNRLAQYFVVQLPPDYSTSVVFFLQLKPVDSVSSMSYNNLTSKGAFGLSRRRVVPSLESSTASTIG